MATPAEPRGDKTLLLGANFWAVKNFEKSAGEKNFKRRESGHVSDRLSDPVSRYSNHIWYRFNNFSGAISVWRRAALKDIMHPIVRAEMRSIAIRS